MNQITTTLKQLMIPVKLPTVAADILVAIPRIVAGILLAFSFGSDKFGMPWTSGDVELSLLQVADWFVADVAEFGGLFALFPEIFAWLGAGSEAIGGLFLLAGFQTRISSFLIACTMLVAIFFQKWGGPVWHMLPAMGFLWVCMIGMAVGSGRVGLDYLISKRRSTNTMLNNKKPRPNNAESSTIAIPSRSVMIVSLTLMATAASAQTNGNGTLMTKTYPDRTITAVTIDLYADITLDANAEGIMIEAESNIIDLIDMSYSDTHLQLSQKQWIEPTLPIRIVIGAASVIELEHDTWGTTTVPNMADIQLTGAAVAKLNVIEKVTCSISDRSTLSFVNTPAITTDCTPQVYVPNNNAKYIDIKIKNNSWARRHFVVVGPKPDGTEFSYGFPMMPGQSKKERWTTGTKIYRENALGIRNLLFTITATDEGKTVKLFE